MSSIEKLKSIFSLEKKETIRNIRRKYFPLIAIGCITIQVFIAASYLDHNYSIDLTLLISSGFLLLVAAYFSFNINKNVNKEKFYIFFLYFPFVLIFLSVNLSIFKRDLVSEFLNLCFGYIILSVTILAVNAAINRFFFSSGELEKTENEEKSVFHLENSKSSDEDENHEQDAPLKHQVDDEQKSFSYIKKEQTVDEISSEFAVDVISIAVFFGIIFGTIAYLFFVPNKDISSFFGGIDVKTVAIATAGLVTFFWAAKAAKNKSIELEEKKQDGKRRDKEIKMAEARDTAQLIAKASELLGSESDAQKYAGLSFLNRVASQKGGPLQKEAFDLLADFILSASDTTTSNKPRMRAIRYVDNLLEESFIYYQINGFIKISGTTRLNGAFEQGNQKYKFNKLNILYSQFYFFPGCNFFLRDEMTGSSKVYDNCVFVNYSGQYGFSIIDNIEVDNSEFVNCIIGSIYDFSLTMEMYYPGYKNPNMNVLKYKFKNCDFSKSEAWSYLSSYIQSTPEARQMFDKCFYYAGHPPPGFDKERDGALLTEIVSEQQFNKLIGKKLFMRYSPPDDDKKTSNK